MEIVSQLVSLLSLVVSIMLIVAVLRIFSIDATLKKVLKKLGEMDQNRRDEFNAMTQEGQ
jgi:hypothetical protein